MDQHTDEERNPYSDSAIVQSQNNDLVPEEFPEGPYRSDPASVSLGKSKPWRVGQHRTSAYDYENKALHDGIPRDYPGEDRASSPIPEVLDEP